jgi:hypothetical protein
VLFVNPTWFVPAVAPVEMPTELPLMRLASVLMSSNASMGGLRQRPWAHRPRRTLTCGASTGPSFVTRPAPLLAGCAYAYLGSSRTAALRRQRPATFSPQMITAALTRLDAEIDSIEAHAQDVYLGN